MRTNLDLHAQFMFKVLDSSIVPHETTAHLNLPVSCADLIFLSNLLIFIGLSNFPIVSNR
ncbi:hypothetical protein PanWU01x14_150050 [Parasponia andersonii]|uniref:Uncharacterized protein n=1 Tax=Parasponia andersonii TaxID=3476 RepID=A0A2P5CIJ6_PARAD|nr:hypothetical protein PanWU01x14_150050 [Parasponia andersonii]